MAEGAILGSEVSIVNLQVVCLCFHEGSLKYLFSENQQVLVQG